MANEEHDQSQKVNAGADSPASTGYKTATIKGFVSPDDFVFELFFGNTKSPQQGLCNLPIWKLDDNIYVTDDFRPIKITIEMGEPIRHQNKDANLQRIKDTESNVQDYQTTQGEPAKVI